MLGLLYREALMSKHRYSPLPIDAYDFIGAPRNEVDSIQRLASTDPLRSLAVWNLFWCSEPRIDLIPALGARWYEKYTPVDGLLAAVIEDVIEDEALFRKLLMHPRALADWLEWEDGSIYTCEQLFGLSWKPGVVARANAAADRMLTEQRSVLFKDDNVVHLDFARRA